MPAGTSPGVVREDEFEKISHVDPVIGTSVPLNSEESRR
jgi:hypothetical protein